MRFQSIFLEKKSLDLLLNLGVLLLQYQQILQKVIPGNIKRSLSNSYLLQEDQHMKAIIT